MKNSFNKLTLLDIASKEKRAIISGPFGSNISSKYFTEQGIPVIRGNNLSVDSIVKFKDENFVFVSVEKAEELNTYAIENDIIFTAVGTLGQVGIIENNSSYKKYIISNKQMRIRLDSDKVNPYYVYYWLTSSWILKSLLNNNTGSAVPLLNLGILKRTPIDLPKDRSHQDKVVNILSTLDKKIALNNQINQELEAMAKTLYDYWFVQFDFPNEEGKPYKSSGGKMVYSEELKREIPEGWETQYLSDFILSIKSGDWGKENKEGNYTKEVSCIRGADFYGLNGKGELKSPTRYILEKNTHKLLESHDVIIEISGGSPTQSTGRLTFVTDETFKRFDTSIIFSNFCRGLVLKNKTQLYYFVYTWNMLYDNRVMFGWEGKTSGLKNLLLENMLSAVQTVVPPQELNSKFYEILSASQKNKQKNLLENQKLTQLRDWLLPMLMNGQVSVADATEQIDELMVAEPKQGYGES